MNCFKSNRIVKEIENETNIIVFTAIQHSTLLVISLSHSKALKPLPCSGSFHCFLF